MRPNLSAILWSLVVTSSCAVATPPPGVPDVPDPRKRAPEKDASSTIYNGQTVPPMRDLSGKTFKEDISKGYWMVDGFSPYCGHCKSLAPKWQTLYEYYYTSDPVPASSEAADPDLSLNTFSRYYDFNFAKLDCVAFGSLCSTIDINAFPTIMLFKDGVEIKRNEGDRSMNVLGKFMEESLEIIRPGSRPKDGVKFPKVGTHGDASLANTKPPALVHKDPIGSASDARRAKQKPSRYSGHPDGKYKVAPAVFIEPTGLANPEGTSVNFTAESFDKTVKKSLDAWFVKFYAPWCPHCLAMAPSWQAMAREMQGKLDVGEVNCDIEARLCRDMGVASYPQIVLMRGPERVEYDGLRGLGDLVSYASEAAEALNGVPDVTAAQFEALEKKEEVVFLYFHDVATTAEDFQALERLPLHLVGRAKLVKTQDPDLVKRFKIHTWPQLLVIRDSQVETYPGLSPAQMRDVKRLVDWMHQVWLPLVPELTASNAREIMEGQFVVLGILSRDRLDEFTVAKREMKSAATEWMEKQTHAFELERQELRDAKQLRIEEAEDRKDEQRLRDAKLIRINMDEVKKKGVRFAWVDGVFWERWLRTTYGISLREGGEKVIINDEDVRALLFLLAVGVADTENTEPPVLGLDSNRQPDRAITHFHPRNTTKGRHTSAQVVTQSHGLVPVALVLQLAIYLQASPHLRLSRCRRSPSWRVRIHASAAKTRRLWRHWQTSYDQRRHRWLLQPEREGREGRISGGERDLCFTASGMESGPCSIGTPSYTLHAHHTRLIGGIASPAISTAVASPCMHPANTSQYMYSSKRSPASPPTKYVAPIVTGPASTSHTPTRIYGRCRWMYAAVAESQSASRARSSSIARPAFLCSRDRSVRGEKGEKGFVLGAWVVLGGDFEQRGEGVGVGVDSVADALGDLGGRVVLALGTYVLIDQEDRNVLALLCEGVKGFFDGLVFGLVVDDEEVLLCVGRGGNVLLVVSRSAVRHFHSFTSSVTYPDAGKEQASDRVLVANDRQELTIFVGAGGSCHCWCCRLQAFVRS
ncbi:hypothetical protein FH972_026149 [Carpinus fangiana]|uniref:Thioredoxin domain-containing protein n=1 Tax=Carpinus fangiana TaxID=176857 RepID=A0A5N6L343_9ROSI|nr:hypothetical protein FH972_026149 [Carpinus fangiana]